jgi:hypothetical protein
MPWNLVILTTMCTKCGVEHTQKVFQLSVADVTIKPYQRKDIICQIGVITL